VKGPRALGEVVAHPGWVDATPSSYRGHRFPVEIISHCVWLYHRFPLSLRDVQEMMMARGVVVSHETIHQWSRKFGQSFADGLRRRRARTGDKWHVDEVFIKINGKTHYLWRAVDQHGAVLDILVGTVRLTMIMIDFASAHTRGGGSTRWTTTTSCVRRSHLDPFRR
jgi:putative transposase